jgi:hypothetical protein
MQETLSSFVASLVDPFGASLASPDAIGVDATIETSRLILLQSSVPFSDNLSAVDHDVDLLRVEPAVVVARRKEIGKTTISHRQATLSALSSLLLSHLCVSILPLPVMATCPSKLMYFTWQFRCFLTAFRGRVMSLPVYPRQERGQDRPCLSE